MNEESLLIDQADIDEHTIDLESLLQLGPMAPVSNPYNIYAALRRDDPVIETTDMMPPDAPHSFLITRYADVR